MIIITRAQERVEKIWGKKAPEQGVVYRPLKYLIKKECDEGLLLLNGVTGELVLLNKEETEAFSSLPGLYNDEMAALVSDRFLVPVSFDEKRSVDQLKALVRAM